jgi:uncharacterized surface protein with fasciclin (FAS1) repeats
VAISNVLVTSGLRVDTSFGHDLVGITNSRIEGTTRLTTGRGNDELFVRNSVHVGRVSVNSGQGDDLVGILGSDLGPVWARLGSGNDEIGVDTADGFSSSFLDSVYIDAGRGEDAIGLFNEDTQINDPVLRGFEPDTAVQDFPERVDEAFASLDDSGLIADRQPTISELVLAIASGENPEFNALLSAVAAARLVNTLNAAGNFTVFAPTNAAFEDLGPALDAAFDDIEGLLTPILLYHVAPQRLEAVEVVGSVDTGIVTLQSVLNSASEDVIGVSLDLQTGTVQLLSANSPSTIIGLNIKTANGIVHIVDTVLLPPSIFGAAVV